MSRVLVAAYPLRVKTIRAASLIFSSVESLISAFGFFAIIVRVHFTAKLKSNL
jgi:hypothetical protein